MEVLQVSNPTGLKRLFNNLLEASACSQRALFVEEEQQKILLSHGEDELARRANPRPGGRSGGAGQGRGAQPSLLQGLLGEQRGFAGGRAPFPSCCFSAPSHTSCAQDSSKPGARRVLPRASTSPSTSLRAGDTGLLRCLRPAASRVQVHGWSLRCQHHRLLLPALADVILAGSSFTSITTITTLTF